MFIISIHFMFFKSLSLENIFQQSQDSTKANFSILLTSTLHSQISRKTQPPRCKHFPPQKLFYRFPSLVNNSRPFQSSLKHIRPDKPSSDGPPSRGESREKTINGSMSELDGKQLNIHRRNRENPICCFLLRTTFSRLYQKI